MAGEKGSVIAQLFCPLISVCLFFETIRDFDEDYDFWYRICWFSNGSLFG